MSLKHDLALCFVQLVRARWCVGLAIAQGLAGCGALPAAHLQSQPAGRGGTGLPCWGCSPASLGGLGKGGELEALGSSGREESRRQEPQARALWQVALSSSKLLSSRSLWVLLCPAAQHAGTACHGRQPASLVQSCVPRSALQLPDCTARVPKAFCLSQELLLRVLWVS